jgi:ribosome maturation factor RimP
LAGTHDIEKTLYSEVSRRVEQGLPDVEVLALELMSPSRFCVYVDRAGGVDHALCGRVTGLLRGYLDRYTVDVSSPGIERPLRRPEHFRSAIGRRVAIRTDVDVDGRKRFRGEVAVAGAEAVEVRVDDSVVHIPYGAIVRANLIDEG